MANLLGKAINSDGTLYNGGKGYKSGYRINSSGVEVAQSGMYVTGFIPVSVGDKITFSDIVIPASNGIVNCGYCYIAFYDSTFTKLASHVTYDWYSTYKSGLSPCETKLNSENKPLFSSITINTSNTMYMRISSMSMSDYTSIDDGKRGVAIATATETISWLIDISSVTRYYLLQSSTLSAPSKPTTNPPSGWTTTEPSYTSGSTSTLYFTDLTVLTNGKFEYSAVSKSSSYEAAKEAYNKATAVETSLNVTKQGLEVEITDARKTATDFLQYDSTNGLQVGNKTSGSWSGTRTKITSSGFEIVNSSGKPLSKFGQNELDFYSAGEKILSVNSASSGSTGMKAEFTPASLSFSNKKGQSFSMKFDTELYDYIRSGFYIGTYQTPSTGVCIIELSDEASTIQAAYEDGSNVAWRVYGNKIVVFDPSCAYSGGSFQSSWYMRYDASTGIVRIGADYTSLSTMTTVTSDMKSLYGMMFDGSVQMTSGSVIRTEMVRSLLDGTLNVGADESLKISAPSVIFTNGTSCIDPGLVPFGMHVLTVGCSVQKTLTTSASKLTLGTKYTDPGLTGILSMNDGGIKVSRAGRYLVWGTVYAQSLTSGDAVHAAVYTGTSSTAGSTAVCATKAWCSVDIVPKVHNLSAGTTIYMYAYNRVGARGIVSVSNSTTLSVMAVY